VVGQPAARRRLSVSSDDCVMGDGRVLGVLGAGCWRAALAGDG